MNFQFAEHSTVIPFKDLQSGNVFLLSHGAGFLVCLAAEIDDHGDPDYITVVLGEINTKHRDGVPAYFDRSALRVPFVVRIDSSKIEPIVANGGDWPSTIDSPVHGSLILDRERKPFITIKQQGSTLFVSLDEGKTFYRSGDPAMVFGQWTISVPQGDGWRVLASFSTSVYTLSKDSLG